MGNKPRVIVQAKGGLGNQLFCYAAGRYLSIVHQCPLIVDKHTGFVRDAYQRAFKLAWLNLPQEVECVDGGKLMPSKFKRKISKFLPVSFRSYLKDKYVRPQVFTAIKKLKQEVYLDGYWQSERYFPGIREVLLEEFRFQGDLPERAKTLLSEVKTKNAVFVHVRRKDYAHLLSEEYYKKAVEKVKKAINDPHFYIFSDDFAWVNQWGIFQGLPHSLVDSFQDSDELVDFEIMKNCQHAIVANSTFSWWAAWLIENPNKVVICPSQTGFSLEMSPSWEAIEVEYI